jgi:hypothetical protein
LAELTWRELQSALDAELQRASYRRLWARLASTRVGRPAPAARCVELHIAKRCHHGLWGVHRPASR